MYKLIYQLIYKPLIYINECKHSLKDVANLFVFSRYFQIIPENVLLLPKKLVLRPVFSGNAGFEIRNIGLVGFFECGHKM